MPEISEIWDCPENILGEILTIEDIYTIKIKCIGCTEGLFLPYKKPVINGNKLIIGKRIYPLHLIEQITIRYYIGDKIKSEKKYKVSSQHLRTLLREDVQEQLKMLSL